MNFTKILTFAIIAMFLLVPFASAKQEVADSLKQDKKIDEKVTDKTKESAKEIASKDKDIKGKVTVTDSDSSKYKVEKKSKTEIRIAKDEVKGEHTKSKVTFAKEDLQKIDEDGDKLYGVLHIADDGTTTHDVVTESELIAGTEMTFSENIVNGYVGYKEYTFAGVTSGQILDISDISDGIVTVSINGTIPTYTRGIPTNDMIAYWPLNGTANDYSGNSHTLTVSNATMTSNGLYLNGFKSAAYVGHFASLNVSNGGLYISGKIYTNSTQINEYSTVLSKLGGGTPGSGYYLYSTVANNLNLQTRHISSALVNSNATALPRNQWNSFSMYITMYNQTVWRNGRQSSYNTISSPIINNTLTFSLGSTSSYTYRGIMRDVVLYSRIPVSNADDVLCAGGSGISISPNPSYNFTGYDVSSGVEKHIDTDTTCTGLTYIDTTGGTHTVTIRVYFTEDITKTTETKGTVYQNVSIVHTKQNATASVGSIAWELDPLYSGDPVLTSNNTNATVSRNDTHVLISTGLVKQGQSFSYAVSVPDNHDHVIFLNQWMQWMGSGWDYVGVAPEDWTDALTDIEVTVS